MVAVLGLAGPAAAAVVPIAGAFGNPSGCGFYLSGQVADDMLVLTGDTVSARTTGCDFIRLETSTEGRYTVESVCSGVGASTPGLDRVIVSDRGTAGFFVKLEGIGEWGPLLRCPEVEELLSPGVRI